MKHLVSIVPNVSMVAIISLADFVPVLGRSMGWISWKGILLPIIITDQARWPTGARTYTLFHRSHLIVRPSDS